MMTTAKRISLFVSVTALAVVAALLVVVLTTRGGGDDVLSRQDVANRLAATPSESVAPWDAAPGIVDPSASAVPVTKSNDAVSVTMYCAGQLAHNLTWSPKPGYRVDDVVRNPDGTSVSIWLESDTKADVEVTVICAPGPSLRMIERYEADDHGGGGDDNGGSGGSGRGGSDDPPGHD